ncbi:large ribosomal subunit mL38 [Hyphodiscus hymeniophilus]|uniref:Large ribosomal subunit protein mL38 n=1 Tax=Hyphodiscus hymeniophilus TaxID=353542 RepID=A0A9P7AX70_9HELO|nr:large ribosomal subunit mL38 [Hyphodiscus hymeniophilus]
MSSCQTAVRPLTQCLRNLQISNYSAIPIRMFTSSSRVNEAATETAFSAPAFDPATVTSTKGEKSLMRSGVLPIGSRRRRAAIKSSDNIPFEQLPYQCFQEALKVLKADREEKMKNIQTERLRISNLEAYNGESLKGGEKEKQRRLGDMRKHLEWLKIQADINDPIIKKRFEDGEGDMNKPIYRYLADRKWRAYQRLIIVQRLNQLSVVPDLLPHFEPIAAVQVAFKQRNVQPGEFVDSRVSELPPRLKVQVFDKGERLVTVVMVDGDVPLVDEDSFMHRCHYLAVNIPISPSQTSLPLSRAQENQLVLPYLPPFAQKGSPYHRYSVFVLEQSTGQTLDVEALKEKVKRDRFSLRSFTNTQSVQPIGVGIFRSLWDDGTSGVMKRAGIEGADVEFKRKRIPALKPKQKARGWEARHASDKYKPIRR